MPSSYNLSHKTYLTYALTTNQSNIIICYKLNQIKHLDQIIDISVGLWNDDDYWLSFREGIAC